MSTYKKTYTSYGNNKSKYYGKFYTYKRIRGIMNKYFRAKISLAGKVYFREDIATLSLGGENLDEQIGRNLSLHDLLIYSAAWPNYKTIFGRFKFRGVLVICTPAPTLGEYTADGERQTKYQGTVRVGIVNSNTNYNYNQMTDANNSMTLAYSNVTRRYFAFSNADWRTVAEDVIQPPNNMTIPYRICVAQSTDGDINTLYPYWSMELTFYVTFAQGIF